MHADAWVLSDDRAGNRKQALALAGALGVQFEAITLQPRAPWRWAAPRIFPGARQAFGSAFATRLGGALPSLAIGCGRQAALALRLLRRASNGRCRTVQILDPRIARSDFDLIVAPAHDGLQAGNVIVSYGALHDVDTAWLSRARLEWDRLGALPAPRTVVLLGGSNSALTLNQDYWRGLATKLGHWQHRDGGSLLISTSRRSPGWLRSAARAEFSAVPGMQWHGPDDGANPYAGLLAWADRIVVTPDSVNLLSEACATAVPVLCHFEEPLRGKHAAFYRDLLVAGRVRPMQLEYAAWPVQPMREMARMAAEVRGRLGLG